jgi:hypothetical protein
LKGRPFLLAATSKQFVDKATCESALRAAIAQDLNAHVPQADAYQMRLHASTVLRVVREMQRR